MNSHREASLVWHNEERAGSDSSFWQIRTGILVSALPILVPSRGLTWGLSGMVARDPPTKPASELLLAPCPHGRQLNPMGNMWPPHRCSLMDGFPMEAALVPRWIKFMKTCRLGWPRVGGQGQGVNIECRQRLRCERWKRFPDVVRVAQQCECIVWKNHYNAV